MGTVAITAEREIEQAPPGTSRANSCQVRGLEMRRGRVHRRVIGLGYGSVRHRQSGAREGRELHNLFIVENRRK
jgi:hypothetical protein